jgi:hypothetical protein
MRQKNQIHNSLLKEKGVGIRLYWLQVLMSRGDNGELRWDVKDSIDPEFAEMDRGSVFRRAYAARMQTKAVMSAGLE